MRTVLTLIRTIQVDICLTYDNVPVMRSIGMYALECDMEPLMLWYCWLNGLITVCPVLETGSHLVPQSESMLSLRS